MEKLIFFIYCVIQISAGLVGMGCLIEYMATPSSRSRFHWLILMQKTSRFGIAAVLARNSYELMGAG